jgi:hypothetical protein
MTLLSSYPARLSQKLDEFEVTNRQIGLTEETGKLATISEANIDPISVVEKAAATAVIDDLRSTSCR